MYKLNLNTHFVGQSIIELSSCPSTNTFVAELLQREVIPNGQVVITNVQTDGRGQRLNNWECQPHKNLTFSIGLFDLDLPVINSFQLSIIASLAIVETINKHTSAQAQIKWPNDIYVNNQKVGGILIENIISSPLITQSVIGIGLNVNQTIFKTPHAASLKTVTGLTFELDEVLTKILEKFEHYLFRKEDLYGLKRLYYRHLLGLNKPRFFKKDGEKFDGTIIGISNSGALEIAEEGLINAYDLKEVQFVF